MTRLLGWIFWSNRNLCFLLIIGIEVSFIDVILIEAFTGIMRSVAFFIPAGLGVQELAFVLIGNYIGLGDSISFSMAIGRRIRELVVGLPAVLTWLIVFGEGRKKGLLNRPFFFYGELSYFFVKSGKDTAPNSLISNPYSSSSLPALIPITVLIINHRMKHETKVKTP